MMKRLLSLLLLLAASSAQANDRPNFVIIMVDDMGYEEKTDLASERPDRAAAMLERLKAWYADTQRNATPQVGGWLDLAEQDGKKN